MKETEFPVCTGKAVAFPSGREHKECPWCETSLVCEPHSFVALEAGCISSAPEAAGVGQQVDSKAFFHLWWHGAHDGGEGVYPGREALLLVADEVEGGQFRLCFCSPDCLRSYLLHVVDCLEERVRSESSMRPAD